MFTWAICILHKADKQLHETHFSKEKMLGRPCSGEKPTNAIQSLKANKNITQFYLFIKKIQNVLQKTLIQKAVL